MNIKVVGKGKKEASIKTRMNKIHTLYRLFTHPFDLSYVLVRKFFILSAVTIGNF
jgi:hypothetical protein